MGENSAETPTPWARVPGTLEVCRITLLTVMRIRVFLTPRQGFRCPKPRDRRWPTPPTSRGQIQGSDTRQPQSHAESWSMHGVPLPGS